MTGPSDVEGHEQQAVVDRPYNTRSGVAPLPSTKATRVPLVRGPPTERYARFRTKCTKRDGTFDEAKAYRRETSFFESKLKHMSNFVLANIEVCNGVLLQDLRNRSITDAVKEEAKIQYNSMLDANMTPRSTSGMWVDDSGSNPEWLVIYAGQRVDGGKVIRDGFELDEVDFMVEQTQNHISVLDLQSPSLGGDGRHRESMKYPFMDYDILTDSPETANATEYTTNSTATMANSIYEPDATETIGLRHDIQCWHGQAHQHINPVPSVQLRGHGSADAARTVRSYILATEQQSKYLSMMLKKYTPAEYAQLKKSADAGRWYTDTQESCTLGLATVWKLQVGLHLDPYDWELCLIVCGGKFNGANLYLPDLNLCLKYNPGDVVIFRSRYLFHAISHWTPGPMVQEDKCTPGRISWVHFTHADVHEKLVDKPIGFFRNGGWVDLGAISMG